MRWEGYFRFQLILWGWAEAEAEAEATLRVTFDSPSTGEGGLSRRNCPEKTNRLEEAEAQEGKNEYGPFMKGAVQCFVLRLGSLLLIHFLSYPSTLSSFSVASQLRLAPALIRSWLPFCGLPVILAGNRFRKSTGDVYLGSHFEHRLSKATTRAFHFNNHPLTTRRSIPAPQYLQQNSRRTFGRPASCQFPQPRC